MIDTTTAPAPPAAEVAEFFVPGVPISQGSKTATRHGVMFDSNAAVLKPWRARVALAALEAIAGRPWRHDGPTALYLTFVFPRLANAPKTKPTKPKTSAPDLDKLTRAVFDALTGVLYHDDAQVTAVFASKRYAERNESAGVWIVAGEAPK